MSDRQIYSVREISYQLDIELAEAVSLNVGRLGLCHFPVGCYVYTGSARRSLEARLRRHLATEKTLRWHIDWLLAVPQARIVQVRRSSLAECQLNQATVGRIVIAGFGASDCRAGCGSHLKWQENVLRQCGGSA